MAVNRVARAVAILKEVGVELAPLGIRHVLLRAGHDLDYVIDAYLELKDGPIDKCKCMCHQPGVNMMHIMACCDPIWFHPILHPHLEGHIHKMNIEFTHRIKENGGQDTLVGVVLNDNGTESFRVQISMRETSIDEAYEMALEMIARGGLRGPFLAREFPIVTVHE